MKHEKNTTKRIVEQIADDKALEILTDSDFLKERNLNRIFHVVRDPRDPSVIVSLTVMENVPALSRSSSE